MSRKKWSVLKNGNVQKVEPYVNFLEHLIGVGLFGLKINLLIYIYKVAKNILWKSLV